MLKLMILASVLFLGGCIVEVQQQPDIAQNVADLLNSILSQIKF